MGDDTPCQDTSVSVLLLHQIGSKFYSLLLFVRCVQLFLNHNPESALAYCDFPVIFVTSLVFLAHYFSPVCFQCIV